jgi:hypothetical protein
MFVVQGKTIVAELLLSLKLLLPTYLRIINYEARYAEEMRWGGAGGGILKL